MRGTLSECPVFIRNMESLLCAVTDILHEIDKDGMSRANLRRFDQAYGIINLAEQSCGLFVEEVERGPDYQIGGAA